MIKHIFIAVTTALLVLLTYPPPSWPTRRNCRMMPERIVHGFQLKTSPLSQMRAYIHASLSGLSWIDRTRGCRYELHEEGCCTRESRLGVRAGLCRGGAFDGEVRRRGATVRSSLGYYK
jgi:hypothetical protein